MSQDHTTTAGIAADYLKFCDLLTAAERCFAEGDVSAAAGLVKMSARRAFPHHIGLFASPRLEHLLLGLGQQIAIPAVSGECSGEKNSRNILHVLTYARPVGGDTRYVWRWMQLDSHSRHSVAITSQNEVEQVHRIPEALIEAATRSGGFVRALQAPSSKPLEQAKELRELCQRMDIVVLHIYPHDTIPSLALAAGCDSTKVIFANLADHAFWVGVNVCDLVVHLRTQSPEFLAARRGLLADESPILPIPLEPPKTSLTTAEAKRALGIDPNKCVLLTIASPFKYEAVGDLSFLDLVLPVVRKYDDSILIAVGPSPGGTWGVASAQTNRRIKALGTRWDNDLLYSAADIYLDSYPFSSITSLLEAGSHGVPLLSYVSPNPELGLLGPGAPGLENVIHLANDPADFRLLLGHLIDDPVVRRSTGERVRAQIESAHSTSNWASAVNDTYDRLQVSHSQKRGRGNNDVFQTGSLDLALARLYSWCDRPSFRHEIQDALANEAYWTRVVVLSRLARIGFRPHILNLLPPPTDLFVRRLARSVRKVRWQSKSPHTEVRSLVEALKGP